MTDPAPTFRRRVRARVRDAVLHADVAADVHVALATGTDATARSVQHTVVVQGDRVRRSADGPTPAP